MGMPDTGYVYEEMHDDIFEEFPEILQILWQENETSKPELRIKTSIKDKPFANGDNSEVELASNELQQLWKDIVATLQSSMLRGWGESPRTTYVMDKDYVDCPEEEYEPLLEDEEE